MRFHFCMMGAAQQPVVEVAVENIAELNELMARTRFVEGRMVEIGGEATARPVLLAVSRVQMVVEAE